MPKIKVGVLRGGPSSEHEISLLTGENVLKNIPRDKYEAVDILIGRDGKWPDFPCLPAGRSEIDVFFNALHGEYGEDGRVQAVLEKMKVPYTGSGAAASALAMNKWAGREIFQAAGLKIPPAVKMEKIVIGSTVEPKFDLPWIVKPVNRGSSVGVFLIKNPGDFLPGLNAAFSHDQSVILEKFIKGREVTAGILENFKGEKYFSLPAVEIVPPVQKAFFDYQSKYDGTAREICPAKFSKKVSRAISEIARRAHEALGCRDYSRTDMIVAEDGIYVLEINTLPGLTGESLFPKAAAAAGCFFDQLLDHLLTLALERKELEII